MSYSRINCENKPSTNTPINAENLNKMDVELADRAMQDKIDEIVQSLEFLLETDPRTFSNPYCKDEHIYHAIAEAIKILKSVLT